MNKDILFSEYVDTDNISTNPKMITDTTQHRHSIQIPFKDKEFGITAIVIMKNPSAAGRKNNEGKILSDDTIYNVLDYLYKLKDPIINNVIIVNLMSIYSGTLSNIIKQATNLNKLSTANNILEIEDIIQNKNEGDIIIAAWGGYPSYPKLRKTKNSNKKLSFKIRREDLKTYYDLLLEQIHAILPNEKVYMVGNLTNENYPSHGKCWYDFEKLNEYPPGNYTI